jgi:antitoxin (DNA-binding transcriptional repressor) of toxin-antitoxin stability system
MSERVSVRQFQERLPELLDRAVRSGEECIIERDGEEYAVLVSAQTWRRREADPEAANDTVETEEARAREVGRRLDSLGPEYRLSAKKQARLEELFARRDAAPLTPAEESELQALVAECDEIMLRRAQALPRVVG